MQRTVWAPGQDLEQLVDLFTEFSAKVWVACRAAADRRRQLIGRRVLIERHCDCGTSHVRRTHHVGVEAWPVILASSKAQRAPPRCTSRRDVAAASDGVPRQPASRQGHGAPDAAVLSRGLLAGRSPRCLEWVKEQLRKRIRTLSFSTSIRMSPLPANQLAQSNWLKNSVIKPPFAPHRRGLRHYYTKASMYSRAIINARSAAPPLFQPPPFLRGWSAID